MANYEEAAVKLTQIKEYPWKSITNSKEKFEDEELLMTGAVTTRIGYNKMDKINKNF